MLKKSLKIFFGLLIILMLMIALLLSDFNPIYKNEEFVLITKEVQKAQKEDLHSFISIYNKIYKKIEEPNCPCQNTANKITNIHYTSLTKRALYWLKIEKEFSHDECLKFVLVHYDFGYRKIGIKTASKFFFNKSIEELNEREKITLIAMLKNSGLYNPIRNKKGVKNRVDLLERISHNQNK
ncbi:transglycosylase domain-containing protein [Flavobacterium panacagri]|uniref:transglycosylase domain-containing protein n=1 Tax=Flavobacterium panacagri TaxID=3034146 RepID=UPI0025A66632|nr:transglycosylase domain-containing protein [Flavobacterium panacagri]